MIITVTLNPAVDKTYITASLIQGQVNRMEEARNLAGGKGINVAKVLNQYSYPVKTLGFLGGYTGKFIENRVKKMGIQCSFTYVSGETRSSINILAADGYVTELLEPGPEIEPSELQLFLEDYDREIKDSDMIILSGSAPGKVPVTIYRELIHRAEKLGKKVLLDTSGELLREGAGECPFMIKPNSRELEMLSGRRLRELEDYAEAAMELHENGISHVMVSMGAKGLLYVTNHSTWYARAPKVKAVNTVGCGDCVVAAFAMAIKQEMTPEELIKFCLGISAANATTLENGIIPRETAEELMNKIEVISY